MVKSTAVVRYAYLHGFASSPLSTKGVQLQRWFRDKLNTSLEIPDLNRPSFRKQSLSHMIDHFEEQIIDSNARWFLIGSSFGGLVSTLVTQRQPELIHSLLLLAPAFDPVQRWTSKIDIAQWRTQGFINYLNPSTQSEEPIDYQFFEDLQSYPSYPIVNTCPVTIIHGSDDDVVPIATSREYMRRLASATKHLTAMIEVDDDHHLKKKSTLNLIKQCLHESHPPITE